MKKIISITVISFLLVSVSAIGQKIKYSKEELAQLKPYYFSEAFNQPATKKVSTLIFKDGTEQKGYCQGIRTKKSQINAIIFKDSISGEKVEIPAEKVAQAYLFGSGFEKFGKVSDQIGHMGTKRKSVKKSTGNDEIYFVNQSVSLKNKKEEEEFLMQLINPDFDDYIAVYYDPRAKESQGVGIGGGMSLGGGVLKSYYVKKGDRIFWMTKGDFKDEYANLFGDNKDFMAKYPLSSVNWDWLSGLILEYTKMQMAQE